MVFGRKPKHRALMVTEDHQLVDVGLDVDAASLSDHRAGRSWGLVPGAVIPQHKTRKPYLLVCPRCNGPYNPRTGKWAAFDPDEVRRIAAQCCDKQRADLPRLAAQELSASMLRLVVAGLLILIGIAILIARLPL